MDGLTDKAVRIKKQPALLNGKCRLLSDWAGDFCGRLVCWLFFCLCKQFLRAAGCRLLCYALCG
ncbi:hypothetical protein HMPREF9098_1872 [Kingella denitrificans ATCC 33394]|uniref:Uncharacterized protein n=1 Tax=Kingella denitrificans ATCC 33394 TaxID=888741 RepID=F0F187_9NEIS|nr:hypothetical protein HMPREF9098_1872 [Kingella denitrificans ATCC 33394]